MIPRATVDGNIDAISDVCGSQKKPLFTKTIAYP